MRIFNAEGAMTPSIGIPENFRIDSSIRDFEPVSTIAIRSSDELLSSARSVSRVKFSNCSVLNISSALSLSRGWIASNPIDVNDCRIG